MNMPALKYLTCTTSSNILSICKWMTHRTIYATKRIGPMPVFMNMKLEIIEKWEGGHLRIYSTKANHRGTIIIDSNDVSTPETISLPSIFVVRKAA
jgi:hypothetical protein